MDHELIAEELNRLPLEETVRVILRIRDGLSVEGIEFQFRTFGDPQSRCGRRVRRGDVYDISERYADPVVYRSICDEVDLLYSLGVWGENVSRVGIHWLFFEKYISFLRIPPSEKR